MNRPPHAFEFHNFWACVRSAGRLPAIAGVIAVSASLAMPARLAQAQAVPQAQAPDAAVALNYPRIMQIRYEAVDPSIGGHFLLWVEREKIFYGLDPRLYPAARIVEVTHITPGNGAGIITTIAVTRVNSPIPDYFHLSGNVRFKVTGMTVRSTNAPSGGAR